MAKRKKYERKTYSPSKLYPPEFSEPIKVELPAVTTAGTTVTEILFDDGRKSRTAKMKAAMPQLIEKMDLLARHYGYGNLGEASPWSLLLNMCGDLLPGFRIETIAPSRPGRKKSAAEMLGEARLVSDVELTKQTFGKMTDTAALRHLKAKNPRYKPWRFGTIEAATERLRRARQSENLLTISIAAKPDLARAVSDLLAATPTR